MRALTAVLPSLLFATPAIACSGGVEVQEMMVDSNNFGWVLFAISALVTLSAALRLRAAGGSAWRWAPFGIVLLSHPGWWLSAGWGDCGTERLSGAFVSTVLLGTMAFSPLVDPKEHRWRPAGVVAVGIALCVLWPSFGLIRFGAAAVARPHLPVALAVSCVLLEYVYGASLLTTLRRGSAAEPWQRRLGRVAFVPMLSLALMTGAMISAQLYFFVRFAPSLEFDHIRGWISPVEGASQRR